MERLTRVLFNNIIKLKTIGYKSLTATHVCVVFMKMNSHLLKTLIGFYYVVNVTILSSRYLVCAPFRQITPHHIYTFLGFVILQTL